MKQYTVIYESDRRNWSAYVPDLSAAIATGKTRQEVEQQIACAVQTWSCMASAIGRSYASRRWH